MSIASKDLEYIWHPYTHQKNMEAPLPIASAKGAVLYDKDDNEYIDAISSWWVNIHGHSHPFIAKELYRQAKTLEHVIFAGFTHKPAVDLAEQLVQILPGSQRKVFYSDNGSTAVEVAIKMALQYWLNRGESRTKVIALNNSYHGDTFGAMSVSNRSIFNKAFNDKLFEVVFIDAPTVANIDTIKKSLSIHASEAACFIYEPLLQAAGGMKIYDAEALDLLLKQMKEAGVICIADEVMTGFFRTGKMFASEYLLEVPDIICLSKGLTGGTIALGVTTCTEYIYNAFVSDDKAKTFYHGHSFTANPLACTAALASLSLLEKHKCRKAIEEIVNQNSQYVSYLQKYVRKEIIRNTRQIGTIIAFEVESPAGDSYLNNIGIAFTRHCLKHGVFLRSLGNTIYTMPPYCITKKQLKKVFKVIEYFLEELITPNEIP